MSEVLQLREATVWFWDPSSVGVSPPPPHPMYVCLFPSERETQAESYPKPADKCEESQNKKRRVGEEENGHWVYEWCKDTAAGREHERGQNAQRVCHFALCIAILRLPARFDIMRGYAAPILTTCSVTGPGAPLCLTNTILCSCDLYKSLAPSRRLLSVWALSANIQSPSFSAFRPWLHSEEAGRPFHIAPCSFIFG